MLIAASVKHWKSTCWSERLVVELIHTFAHKVNIDTTDNEAVYSVQDTTAVMTVAEDTNESSLSSGTQSASLSETDHLTETDGDNTGSSSESTSDSMPPLEHMAALVIDDTSSADATEYSDTSTDEAELTVRMPMNNRLCMLSKLKRVYSSSSSSDSTETGTYSDPHHVEYMKAVWYHDRALLRYFRDQFRQWANAVRTIRRVHWLESQPPLMLSKNVSMASPFSRQRAYGTPLMEGPSPSGGGKRESTPHPRGKKFLMTDIEDCTDSGLPCLCQKQSASKSSEQSEDGAKNSTDEPRRNPPRLARFKEIDRYTDESHAALLLTDIRNDEYYAAVLDSDLDDAVIRSDAGESTETQSTAGMVLSEKSSTGTSILCFFCKGEGHTVGQCPQIVQTSGEAGSNPWIQICDSGPPTPAVAAMARVLSRSQGSLSSSTAGTGADSMSGIDLYAESMNGEAWPVATRVVTPEEIRAIPRTDAGERELKDLLNSPECKLPINTFFCKCRAHCNSWLDTEEEILSQICMWCWGSQCYYCGGGCDIGSCGFPAESSGETLNTGLASWSSFFSCAEGSVPGSTEKQVFSARDSVPGTSKPVRARLAEPKPPKHRHTREAPDEDAQCEVDDNMLEWRRAHAEWRREAPHRQTAYPHSAPAHNNHQRAERNFEAGSESSCQNSSERSEKLVRNVREQGTSHGSKPTYRSDAIPAAALHEQQGADKWFKEKRRDVNLGNWHKLIQAVREIGAAIRGQRMDARAINQVAARKNVRSAWPIA